MSRRGLAGTNKCRCGFYPYLGVFPHHIEGVEHVKYALICRGCGYATLNDYTDVFSFDPIIAEWNLLNDPGELDLSLSGHTLVSQERGSEPPHTKRKENKNDRTM